jgi:hypothetical protein
MPLRTLMRLFTLLTVGLGLCYCEASSAALGASVESVGADMRVFRAERRITPQPGYEMHELTAASGTVVREYADKAGHVFAVTWQGQFRPDLQQLLGDSYARFSAAAQLPHPARRALTVHDSDLVIESTGHMRAFAGRAYLPRAVPAGLDVGALQ